ncbi:MAG: hypothetical protein Q8Q01_00585 [archaeon]|nr:hypothetical protein [archaeon]
MVIFTNVNEDNIAILLRKGYTMGTVKTQYEKFRLSKKGVILIHYTSGKLLLQGKEDKVDYIADELKSLGIGKETRKTNFKKEIGLMVGSDEALKGDTFGGIVVAAVQANETDRQKLIDLGVADSKLLKDTEIISLAGKIKAMVTSKVIIWSPEEYNAKEGNVTKLLNDLHSQVVKGMKGKHVVDKYPGCNVGEIIEIKAESHYVEVAAASILARAAGLDQLVGLSKKAGFDVPKGSTHVKGALELLKKKKLPFDKFVKLHFKNVEGFMGKGI